VIGWICGFCNKIRQKQLEIVALVAERDGLRVWEREEREDKEGDGVVFGFVYDKWGMRVFLWRERERERKRGGGGVGELLNQVKTNGAAGWMYSRVHTSHTRRDGRNGMEREVRISSTWPPPPLFTFLQVWKRDQRERERERERWEEGVYVALPDRMDWRRLVWCSFFG
jgi:hypothetical protein